MAEGSEIDILTLSFERGRTNQDQVTLSLLTLEASTPRRIAKVLVGTALCIGSLDMLVAMSKFVLTTGRSALRVPVYIASGIFGQAAFTGSGMAVWGLLLHYIIAWLFTSFYFWLAHQWSWLLKHWVVSGVAYGLGVWAVMNLLVVPVSQAPSLPLEPVNAGLEALILIGCIGLPISFLASRFARQHSNEVEGHH